MLTRPLCFPAAVRLVQGSKVRVMLVSRPAEGYGWAGTGMRVCSGCSLPLAGQQMASITMPLSILLTCCLTPLLLACLPCSTPPAFEGRLLPGGAAARHGAAAASRGSATPLGTAARVAPPSPPCNP